MGYLTVFKHQLSLLIHLCKLFSVYAYKPGAILQCAAVFTAMKHVLGTFKHFGRMLDFRPCLVEQWLY